MLLVVVANAFALNKTLQPRRLQNLRIANARELQNLWCSHRAARYNDFTARADLMCLVTMEKTNACRSALADHDLLSVRFAKYM